MAQLTTEQRRVLWAELMQEWSAERVQAGLSKADLRAAVDALDVWLDANAAAINTAIPQPARGALSTPQKARLLMFVVRARYVGGA